MMRFAIIVFCLLVAAPAVGQGMPDSLEAMTPRYAKIGVVARSDNDSIVLRWAPTKPGAWRIASKLGYFVERITISKNGALDTNARKRLTPAPIIPWSLAQLKERFKTREDFVGIAGQTLYGKSFVPPVLEQGTASELVGAAQELENRYGFAMLAADNDAKAAEVLGLRFVDHDVKAGETYAYRIYTASRDTSYRIDTGYCVADASPFVRPLAPNGLIAKGGDKNILLEWENSNIPRSSGFYVERSDDGGSTYRPLNTFPLVNVTPDNARAQNNPRYEDTTVQDYKHYRYRVYGMNAFGDRSEPAEVEAYGEDFTPPPAPFILPTEQVGMNRVRIKWEMKQTVSDLKGFVVAKSDNSLTGFVPVSPMLSPTAHEWVDDSASEDFPFYLVSAVDTATNLAPSVSIMASVVDTLPPMVPKGLTGTCDTNGVVTLHWKLSSERKLKGYRVLWANDLSHEFTQRVNHVIEDTMFVDTVSLNTLTEYVYYQIAAVDKRFGHSAPCAPIAVRRPDRIAPEASVFTGVHNSTSSIDLAWAPSTSRDVRDQILLRRKAEDKAWSERSRLAPKAASFSDKDVTQGQIYYYRLDVVDSSGLHSKPSMDVQGRAYDDGVRTGVQNLQANYDAQKKSTRLSWSYSSQKKEKYWFVIYRAFGAAKPAQYRSVASDATTFTDQLLVGNGTYHYAIRVLSATGDSGLSDPVTVEVK